MRRKSHGPFTPLASLFALALIVVGVPTAIAGARDGRLDDAPREPIRPPSGPWLLDVDPHVTEGETARQLSLDMLDGVEALLESLDFGRPAVESSLGRQVEELRFQLETAPPEELQLVADSMGSHLPALHRAVALQVGAHLAIAAASEGKATAPAFAPKSGGFPTLTPGIPAYPDVTGQSVLIDQVFELFNEDSIRRALAAVARAFAEVDIPLCRVEVDADGRAERLSNELVFAGTVTYQVQDLLNNVSQDICGGAAVDITVVSLGASCSICCLQNTVLHGVATLLYETTMLCQSMVDSAEVEAAWHAGKTVVEQAEHLHGDVEAVQQTADEILDAVRCRPVDALLRGHGCDGLDSDCDGVIDECDEDVVGPELHVDEAVAAPWYPSRDAARAAVLRGTSASDDCRAVDVDLAPLTGPCGALEATVTARDACGNATTRVAVVRVDEAAPTVAIPASLTASCHADVDAAEAAVLSAVAVTDDCSAPGEITLGVESAVTGCSLRVRVTATDRAGRTGTAAVTVRVDERAPTSEIDRLALATLGPSCFESVADAEAAVASFVRTSDDCSGAAALAPVVTSSGDPCRLLVVATATDECGATASDQVEVRVDAGAPTLATSLETDRLWPPSHELIDVGLSIEADDDCEGEVGVAVRVTSDEPTATADGAGGDRAPDAVVLRDADGRVASVLLRAERSSSGNGRVYRIRVEATDPCGNVTRQDLTVGVPPNGGGSAVDDGQHFDATGAS